MSYTPTEWKKGDLITSEKLNKIEEGIVDAAASGGGGFLVIHLTESEESIFDKTLGEIKAAFTSEIPIFIFTSINISNINGYSMGICIGYANVGQYYEIRIFNGDETVTFYAVEDSDYPTTQQPSSGGEI